MVTVGSSAELHVNGTWRGVGLRWPLTRHTGKEAPAHVSCHQLQRRLWK